MKTILTIDDEEMIRASMAAYLEGNGYRVLEAEGGRQGLELIRREHPDLVLVDLRMPDMDGTAVLAAMRQETPDIPAIVVSGTGVLEDALEAVRQGAWEYVTKPIGELATLLHAVESVLEKARLVRENKLHQETLEQQVRIRTQELEEAKDRAEAANRSKSEFLATMSHEIRTPLAGVLGMLQLLQRTSLSNEQQEYVDIGLASGKTLLSLIEDILSISQIEQGVFKHVEGPCDVLALVSSVAKAFELEIKAKGLTLEVSLDAVALPGVVADEARIRQILFNLVGNAVKFTDQGHIRIEAALARHQHENCRGTLAILVEDSGVGIPNDKLGLVFQPFTQVDGSYSRKFQGAGLGLYIVRRLLTLLGGSLCLESATGQGTACHLGIPLRLDACQEVAAAAPPLLTEVAGLRILLVEDECVNRLTGRRLLGKMGHQVVDVANGREALEALAGERFDLVLMDIQMPVMDGMEATRRIRADTSGAFDPHIPIIAMTAYAMNGDREKFLAGGMDGYASKPVDMAELTQAMSRAFLKTQDVSPSSSCAPGSSGVPSD